MAFDGITTCALVRELSDLLTEAKIDKIYQPEPEDVVLSVRARSGVYRLLLSANRESARFYLTEKKPETPLQPPMFCMLLRKHFSGGRICAIRQIGFDRIVEIEVEAYNELSDRVRRRIVLELMGRHSNLILIDENGRVIDCIHHVRPDMSRFRILLPGTAYEAPTHNHKEDPTQIGTEKDLSQILSGEATPLDKVFYEKWNGISPQIGREICFRASLEGRRSYPDLNEEEKEQLQAAFTDVFDAVRASWFVPAVYQTEDGKVIDFAMIALQSMAGLVRRSYESPSALLDDFYASQEGKNQIRQKAQNLHKTVMTHLERARRKEGLQEKQMADTEGREQYQRIGDLIIANLYAIEPGTTRVEVDDFYEDPPQKKVLNLQSNLTPSQNAQKYYARYNKLKRTAAALTEQLAGTREEIAYLESILQAMELADCEQDLEDIRSELVTTGYLRRTRGKVKNLSKSRPLEGVTSEGVRYLIGKNNVQNDQLTFRTARPYDLWFHVKNVPGSHTILQVDGLVYGEDYTDQSLYEAAVAALMHSSLAAGRSGEVDYTQQRYVKKPSGSKPGFVNYTHQKTIYVRE